MASKVLVALVVLGLAALVSADLFASAIEFGYDENERSLAPPSQWGTLGYSKTCGTGKRQSPIDIPYPSPVSRSNGPLTVAYKPTLVHVTNNGHAFTISTRDRYLEHSVIFVQNLVYAPLGYRLFQFHFHWGLNNTQGSEHTLNGKQYPLEGHFVHYNSRFPSIDAAVRSGEPDALIVIGVFFEVGATSPTSVTQMLTKLPYFRSVGNEVELDDYLNLSDMFPARLEYFTYLGSFTTPRCNEANRWIVLARPVSITQADLDKIRTVHINLSATKSGPGFNFRPVQPLHDRKVTSSFATLPHLPSATPPPAATATPTPTPTPEAFEE